MYWVDPAKESADQYSNGEWSTGIPSHAVIHELGHLAHYRYNAMAYQQAANAVFSPNQTAVAAKVSKYAAKEPREFVAETFVLLFSGLSVEDDVLALYQEFGGYLP